MGFIDRFTKEPMSFDAAGKQLASVAASSIDRFLQEDLPEIADCLDVDLDTFDINVLRGETMIVCLWAATKSLENEDQRLINVIHTTFFGAIGDDRRSQFQKMFSHRSDKYSEAWDETSGGNQSILAVNILSEMFNDGELEERLLDIVAMSLVQTFVFNTMLSVFNDRKKVRLIA